MLINDRNYEIKFTGKTLLLYKEEFGKDLFMSLEEKNRDTIFLLQLVWVLIKTCDDSVLSFKEWTDSLSMFEITKILCKENVEEMTSLFLADKVGTKTLKKK